MRDTRRAARTLAWAVCVTVATAALAAETLAADILAAANATAGERGPWTHPAGLIDANRPLPPLPSGPSPADPIDTDWRVLLGLNYQTGEISPQLEERRGKLVRIPGFMVPFEDGMSGVNEFLLVPYFGACIHTPPPPPNQIVYVRMEGGRRVEVNIWDAIYLEGIFEVESIESPYGSVGHQVLGQAIKPYTGGR